MNSDERDLRFKFYFATLWNIHNSCSGGMRGVCLCDHMPFLSKACQDSCQSKQLHFIVCIGKIIAAALLRQNLECNVCLDIYFPEAFLYEFQWLRLHVSLLSHQILCFKYSPIRFQAKEKGKNGQKGDLKIPCRMRFIFLRKRRV